MTVTIPQPNYFSEYILPSFWDGVLDFQDKFQPNPVKSNGLVRFGVFFEKIHNMNWEKFWVLCEFGMLLHFYLFFWRF